MSSLVVGFSLDNYTRELMESRFGYDFSQIRIHTGEMATKSTNSINALAYATGNDIVFCERHYNP